MLKERMQASRPFMVCLAARKRASNRLFKVCLILERGTAAGRLPENASKTVLEPDMGKTKDSQLNNLSLSTHAG